jgi:preprotein translocase subunit SecG
MWLSIVIPILLSILSIVCILLTLVVLMQRPKNEGLGAAFGSSMTENIFGAQTATVLTKATVYLGCVFFGLTLLLTVLTARQSRRVGVLENEVRKAGALPTPKLATSPIAAGSPQAPASVTASASPAASGMATTSATPAASATTRSSTAPAASASASPSSSVATNSTPTATPGMEQPTPASSASPQN